MFLPESIGLSVRQLIEEGNIKEAMQIVLEIEKASDLSLKELLSYRLVKANLLRLLGNYPEAIEIAKEIFKEFQKLGDLVSSLDALLIELYSYMALANVTQREHRILQVEKLFKNIKHTLALDLREREAFFVRIKANIYFFNGEVQRSLELNKKSFKLANELGNEELISASLNNIAHCYYHLKKYDEAIMYAMKAIKVNHSGTLAVTLGTLIEVYVAKGDIKAAKVYLDHLREYVKKFDSKWNKNIYYSVKALILKSSLRARERIKSEDLFKKLACDSTVVGELRIDAIIELCDLYLTELRITNDLEIIKQIHPCIQELLTIAEKQKSYFYLAETHLLQAKLSLLTLDIKKAKQFLIQAQNVAESYGMKRLAMRISNEHDELLRHIKKWENLKNSEVSLSERLELTGLNEQIESMIKSGMIEVPEISKEDPVMLLILTEGGDLLFSKRFVDDVSFEDDILGGFLTSINYFIRELFSEGLDRAVFGQYTLLMMPVQPFLICYIFKGYSYCAYQKIKVFLDAIQNDIVLWQSLNSYFQKSKSVQSDSIPSLDSLIAEIFVG